VKYIIYILIYFLLGFTSCSKEEGTCDCAVYSVDFITGDESFDRKEIFEVDDDDLSTGESLEQECRSHNGERQYPGILGSQPTTYEFWRECKLK
jgi:hypothetical protein